MAWLPYRTLRTATQPSGKSASMVSLSKGLAADLPGIFFVRSGFLANFTAASTVYWVERGLVMPRWGAGPHA